MTGRQPQTIPVASSPTLWKISVTHENFGSKTYVQSPRGKEAYVKSSVSAALKFSTTRIMLAMHALRKLALGLRLLGFRWSYNSPNPNTADIWNFRSFFICRCQIVCNGSTKMMKSDTTLKIPENSNDKFRFRQLPVVAGFQIFSLGMQARIVTNICEVYSKKFARMTRYMR